MTKLLAGLIKALFLTTETELRDFRDFSYHKVVAVKFPLMFWAQFMTVGNFIFCDKKGWMHVMDHMNGHETAPSLMNELIHVYQWRKYRYMFILMYTFEAFLCILRLKRPHKHSKYEVESRLYQDQYTKAKWDYNYNISLSKHLMKKSKED